MRNDLLTGILVVLALLAGYWFFHSSHSRGVHELLNRASLKVGSADTLMRDDMTTASGRIKTSVAEFYASRGQWPTSNAEAGLPAPGEFRGDTLRSATVLPDGSIEFVFDATSGRDGGVVMLVADTTHANAMGVKWNCQSGDYPTIARIMSSCTYVGQ